MGELYVHPGGFSSAYAEILLQELGVAYRRRDVDLHAWQQFTADFLAVNPLGTVPVFHSADVGPVVGIKSIRKYLETRPDLANHDIFKGERVSAFLSKLEAVPVGVLTYGLAFHTQYTRLLRYPYSEGNFFETARDYILSREARLGQAALDMDDAVQSDALLQLAEEHRAGLAAHLEEANFRNIFREFQDFLDFFEKELESETRCGIWLGGVTFSAADIALGLILHRLWQLGLDTEYFSDGVRPHLSLYYARVMSRSSFKSVTRCDVERGELRIEQPEDKMVDNARFGLGLVLLMGGLYIGKKILRK